MLKRYLVEGLIFLSLFFGTLFSFYSLEKHNPELLANLLSHLSLCGILSAMAISLLLSAWLCHYFKPLLESISFMKSVSSDKTKRIEIKKLLKSKKLMLLLIGLAVLFYISHKQVIEHSDFSMLTLFIVLTIYAPISTLFAVKYQLQQKNLTFKDYIKNRKNNNND